MKKVITAILPLILAAQIPFNATSYLPSDWMKNIEYGLKWTELMINGYPGVEQPAEVVPEGVVTTTVKMAGAIPEYEHAIQIRIQETLCDVEMQKEIRIQAVEALQAVKQERMVTIRTSQLL